MTLTPPQRIPLIRESATLLDKQEWDEIDLVLGQFGLPTSDYDVPNTKSAYVIQMIKDASDQSLTDLHSYLVGEASGAPATGSGPWSGEKLRLFASHLAKHKDIVGAVGTQLSYFGVEAFVAHDAIEPSREWIQVIQNALFDCDAMIVFLHEGFVESQWCDQEVGWALGRQRPVLPLNYGINPYGFLGQYQAQKCGLATPAQVADYVMDWLVKTPSLHGRLAHGLADALVNSHSWDFTRRVAPLLERMTAVTDDDLTRMEKAAQDNIDVRDCMVSTVTPAMTGPEWVAQFVAKRRGPTSAAAWSVDDPAF